ncbi:very-short-patch-repair endonuclease [Friedmanniella endophytica]|uniref:Very-short-patch-repair endonuclease n=1 Tax=Microlunatus kandeliicorticis TaxID=1759536 RepID=A0A7W3P509_9ACTN|nr:type IV toxin-antitoxin system AbiEi family antitoxin domain-containing protein [Microlunatus kandeliicorticis]MBA8793471.1 very-short-patch-repair endonuclease [Microlunatus kandeliicorticis]
MHARQPVPPSLFRLALLQAGVVTREQAVGCGLGARAIDRLVADGRWLRLAPGVYWLFPARPPGTPGARPPWVTRAWAGCLLGGDRARLGGAAAGHLWGLDPEPPELITVLVPHGGTVPRHQGQGAAGWAGRWSFVRERAAVRDPRSPGSPPRTGLTDTVLDLVAADGDAVRWTTAAVQTGRVSVHGLRAAADRRARLRHRRRLLVTLDDLAVGAESALELVYLRAVERAHGLPVAERQVRRRDTRADVLYRDFGLLVELDGRRGHEGAGRFRDMRRDNRATTDGLATLRYGWSDVRDRPCEVAAQVAENLVRRGWTGLPARCARCRRVA